MERIGPDNEKLQQVMDAEEIIGEQQARTEEAFNSINRLKEILKIEVPEEICSEITKLAVKLYKANKEHTSTDSPILRLNALGINTKYIDTLFSDHRPVLQEIVQNFKQQYQTKIYMDNLGENDEQR